MSWSVSAIGKPAAVQAKLEKDFTIVKCQEPEETIKNLVRSAVLAGLSVFPKDQAVKVTACGSQYCPRQSSPEELTNSLSVVLEPLHGFVE